MNVRIFGIGDRSTLEPMHDATLSAAWQEDSQHRWIDVEAASEEELRAFLSPLDLHDAIQSAALQPERSVRFISHASALYVELPTHLGWDEIEKPYLSVLCLPTTLITIHRDRLHTIDDIIRDLDADIPLYDQTVSALLYCLLIGVSKCNVDAALDLRAEAEKLDQACHAAEETLEPRQIAVLRRKASHCSAVHDDHIYCAGVLQTVESKAFSVSAQGRHFQEMLKLAGLAGKLIDGAEARVASLQRDYENSVQANVENRLRFLTVLSAVFLLMTLISAVYGMNFNDLPAMGAPHGYLLVIALMLLSAGLTGGYLYWRGWFK